MEKLELYRAALNAASFLVDFMTKENFYSSKLHSELWHFTESLSDKVKDTILDHVMPKVDA